MKNRIVAFESKFGVPEKFNSQFHMVKIYIAYAGKNRNQSIISKETFEKMIPSLYGIPVIGEWKGEDFGGHGGVIEISDDGVKEIDTTKPYGFVDSSAKVQWEAITEEDGVKREYLTTTAFLWTKRYPEALKVLENKSNHSMEINVFDGFMSEDHAGYFEVTGGEFSALCILGEAIEPCFESSKISQFNLDKDSFKSEFTKMVSELKSSLKFSSNQFEGGEKVDKQKITKSEEVEVVKVEDVEETIEDEKFEEEEIVEDDSVVIAEESVANAEDTKEQSDIDSARILVNKLEDGEDKDALLSRLDAIQVDSETDTDTDIEDSEEDYELKYTELLDKFNTLEEEMVELKEFKDLRLQEDFELEQAEIKAEKVKYINDNYADLKEDVKEMFIGKVDEYESVEDIDADICVYIVKNKLSFAKSKKEVDSVKIGITEDSKNRTMSPYGALFSKRI